MRVRNREGEPVDPVPFVVVAGSAWLFCLSFGPLYLGAFAVPWQWGLAVSAATALAATLWAYHRFVWAVDPTVRRALPPELRFRRLCYGAFVFGVVFLVLTVVVFVNAG